LSEFQTCPITGKKGSIKLFEFTSVFDKEKNLLSQGEEVAANTENIVRLGKK